MRAGQPPMSSTTPINSSQPNKWTLEAQIALAGLFVMIFVPAVIALQRIRTQTLWARLRGIFHNKRVDLEQDVESRPRPQTITFWNVKDVSVVRTQQQKAYSTSLR
ncbi:hypothetical protein CC78DRAFT_575189 [Lojkania enalia]|uniref:Uncharacterized protein n=1 Tax=Lojkania enalia TaxID=147567 RepID=A0A9P4N9I0_9PLEO|nr:hypothetical protein CC78DRAFT_575189 [Didymosphaeria enalia]